MKSEIPLAVFIIAIIFTGCLWEYADGGDPDVNILLPGPELIFFFMLNSIKHKIFNARKYKNIKKFGFFLGSDKPRMLFSRS